MDMTFENEYGKTEDMTLYLKFNRKKKMSDLMLMIYLQDW
jgi:hypothetical protein